MAQGQAQPLPEITDLPFSALINTHISIFSTNFTCPHFTKLSANELLLENRVTVKFTRQKATFRCINNYYPVSGDLVRTCEEGRWTGDNPRCEVMPLMRKQILATAIATFACLLTIPCLCCDFFWKLDDRRDLQFYRFFRNHYSKRLYPGEDNAKETVRLTQLYDHKSKSSSVFNRLQIQRTSAKQILESLIQSRERGSSRITSRTTVTSTPV